MMVNFDGKMNESSSIKGKVKVKLFCDLQPRLYVCVCVLSDLVNDPLKLSFYAIEKSDKFVNIHLI